MCGICGVFSDSPNDERRTIVSQMCCQLVHRGPDDSGQHDDARVSLAMRRLSIIDLSGGHQPIQNEDGQLIIVFNGEIYNFPELRDRLLARGHTFQTNTDTEVILHLYEDEAENTPALLRGMFAFCIYDRRDDSIFIARDRFGEKPLFYARIAQGGLAFSSEIKSLLCHPAIARRLDHDALAYFLRAGVVPAPWTMFRDVRVLPPGHWLKWRDAQLDVRPYHTIDYQPDPTLENEADAVAAVQTLLRQSVQRQSISDVPLGALLSGGIDSCAVASMLQATSSRPVKTFTVRFEDAGYDEGDIASQVARHLGTEHHEFFVGNATFQQDDLWRIVDHVGLPFFDSSAIPTYVLSKHVVGEVKVALSGDGGDEMFAGYDSFQWGLAVRRAQRWPSALLRVGATTTGWASRQSWLSGVSALRRLRRGLDCAAGPAGMLPIALHNLFVPQELKSLVSDQTILGVSTGTLPLLTDLPERAQHWSPLRQLMYFRLKHVMPDRMLTKVDRMSMANSLEIRTPLLDADLAELSMRLPDKHLIQSGVGKSILRKAIRDHVPEIVFSHPKSGFDIPLHRFQNAEYRELARELLGNGSDVVRLFHLGKVQELIDTGLDQKSDRADRSVFRASHQLWALMQLAAWQQRFGIAV